MNLNKPKQKLKGLGKRLFAKFFGFETGIDITNDVAVLHRRNVVIKNIVFVSNIVYSIIFFFLALVSDRPLMDWLITALAFPITYAINKLLTNLINLDHNDKTKQQIAMYVSSFYIFLSAMLVYLRIYGGVNDEGVNPNAIFETAAYVLIFYALVQISLYQDKRLLSSSFISLLGVVTIIHVVWTHNFFDANLGWKEFIEQKILTREFGDLVLRTVIFSLFYLVLYVIVSIGQSIQDERKKELSKRRQVQSDFAHIVRNLFSVVFSSSSSLLDVVHANQVAVVANALANYYNASEDAKKEISEYALIHLKFDEIQDLVMDRETYDEHTYDLLKAKTELGGKIARRLQLAQKSLDILRVHHENNASENFLKEMQKIQPNIEAQIILLADMYVSLRNVSSYRRPFTHAQALQFFQRELTNYFDYNLKETFLRYNEELNQIYQNL